MAVAFAPRKDQCARTPYYSTELGFPPTEVPKQRGSARDQAQLSVRLRAFKHKGQYNEAGPAHLLPGGRREVMGAPCGINRARLILYPA